MLKTSLKATKIDFRRYTQGRAHDPRNQEMSKNESKISQKVFDPLGRQYKGENQLRKISRVRRTLFTLIFLKELT